jgi:hypothetical protein
VSEEVEVAGPAATVGAQPDRDVRVFAELYAVHGAHVFDYCRAVVGSDAVAVSITRAALVSAPQLPQAPHLLRAGLIAAARQEARAFATVASGWLGAGAAGLEVGDGALRAALRQLPAGHREVLALVYRYDLWPEQLPAVLGVPARDAYARLAAAEYEFVTAAAAQADAGSSSRSGTDDQARPPSAWCPSLEDIGAAPLATVPASVWPDAVAELTALTSVATAMPGTPLVGHPDGSLAAPRRRLRLTIAAALPAAALVCWAILAGAGSAHPGGVHDAGRPSAIGVVPRSSSPTATPDGAGTSPARQATEPARQGTAPVIPVLSLLPSTPAGTVLPVTTTTAAADPASSASPSVSATPSSSPPASSAAPSASASPSSGAPSPSASASPSASTSSAAPSPSPSDSPSSASTSVPDPSPTS